MSAPRPLKPYSCRLSEQTHRRLRSLLKEQAAAPYYIKAHMLAESAFRRELDRLENCLRLGLPADLPTEGDNDLPPTAPVTRRTALNSHEVGRRL